MKNLTFITFAVLIATLSGCQVMDGSFLNKIGASQVEKENIDTISSKIIKGKTSKDDVLKIFGKPQSRSKSDNGGEYWTYSDMNFNTNLAAYIPNSAISGVFGKTTAQSKSLVIAFNKAGIVQSYTFDENGY